MTIQIRPAHPADLPEIKLLLRESAEHLNAIDEPEPIFGEDIDRIEQLAFGPGAVCTILVAERDGKVAGHLSYFWELSMEGVAPGAASAAHIGTPVSGAGTKHRMRHWSVNQRRR